MTPRHAVAGTIVAAVAVAAVACGPAPAPGPPLPEIVEKAIAYHGGDLYERSRIRMTISSLSGSFDIEAMRDGGRSTTSSPIRPPASARSDECS